MRFFELFEDFKTAKRAFINQGVDPADIDELFLTYRTLTKKNQFQGVEKNIDYWAKKDWFDFKDRVEQQAATPTKTDIKKARDMGNAIALRDDEQWLIVVPKDKAASVHFGRGSDWCTTKANQNYFESYFIERGVTLVYCLKQGTDRKWAIAMHQKLEQMEFFTKNDTSIKQGEFEKQTGLKAAELREQVMQYMPELNKARDAANATDPERAVKYAKGLGTAYPAGEKAIATKANTSVDYAYNVLKGRFKMGEPAIMRDPQEAVFYANKVIQGRWPEAEATIATDPMAAIEYAKYVIRGAWPEGEDAIAADASTAIRYAHSVLKGRFAKAEPMILKNPISTLNYLQNVVKGPWPEAEAIIKRSASASSAYQRITGKKL